MMRLPRLVTALFAVALGAAVLTGCAGGGTLQADPAMAYQDAENILLLASKSPDGATRSRALEALGVTEGAEAAEAYLRGLDDEAVAVQFAAAMAAGDCRCQAAAKKLEQVVASDKTDPNVRLAAIYALFRLGDKRYTNQIGRMLTVNDPEVRANAALVIAKIGDSHGITPLRARLDDERHAGVKLQLAESLAALGEPRSITLLYAYVRSGQLYEGLRAVQALSHCRGRQALAIIRYAFLPDKPLLLRVAAAGALGHMGDDRGYNLAIQAACDPQSLADEAEGKRVILTDPQVEQVQLLAALALGQIGRKLAVDALLPLLNHKNPTVAVAAAKSILMLLPPPGAEPAEGEPARPESGDLTGQGTGEGGGEPPAVAPRTAPKGPSIERAPAKD